MVESSSSAAPSTSTSPQNNNNNLRRRNHQILRQMHKDQREEQRVKDIISKSSSGSSNKFFIKFFVVIGTAIAVTVMAALNYTRPPFLFGAKKKIQPPYYIATFHPPNVNMDRDLPRFFRTYSIATPQNKDARVALRRVIANRIALSKKNGNIKVLVKGWDKTNIDELIERQICGSDFAAMYYPSSQERRDDLLMWCLLATRIADGVFLHSVEFFDSAFIIAKGRGMVVNTPSSMDFRGVFNSYYLQPRIDQNLDTLAKLPSQVLTWLLTNPEHNFSDKSEARQMLRYLIDDLVSAPENSGMYMHLDAVCQANKPPRSIGKECHPGEETCCYFVVPKGEGGRYEDSSD